MGYDSDRSIDREWGIWPMKLHPTEIEHFPTTKCCLRTFKGVSPRTELDAIVVYVIANGRSPLRCTDKRVGKSLVVLTNKKVMNRLDGGFFQGKHEEEKNTALSQRIVERMEEHATLPGEERGDMKQYRTNSGLSSMWYVYCARV